MLRDAREVRVAGEPVALTSREFDLLSILLGNPDRVLTRELLLDRVWGLAFPGGTRTVDMHVASLRRKLGRPELVQTVRGAGYKLGPRVTCARAACARSCSPRSRSSSCSPPRSRSPSAPS